MPTQPPPIASKALEANFQQTASTVAIPPRYAPLREAVARYQGLSARLEHLLYEISHPFRNWQLIIAELRPFVLKNLNHYLGHAQGPDCFAFSAQSFFIDALKDSRKNSKVIFDSTYLQFKWKRILPSKGCKNSECGAGRFG